MATAAGARGSTGSFCPWCGSPAGGCDGVSCRRPLDPPHYCTTCGRRMRVQVTPTGWTASCRDHGAPILTTEP